MIPFGQDEMIKVDLVHSNMIGALVAANKSKNILELGIGGGRSTDAILSALEFNRQPYQYTLVDNWNDFGFVQPQIVTDTYASRINLVTANEKDFIDACTTTYDFIMSDADHMRTQEWFEHVYDDILEPGGILCYHDVNLFESEHFVNLRQIYYKCQERKLNHMLFNKNSIPGERCQRGLLVIFKNQ